MTTSPAPCPAPFGSIRGYSAANVDRQRLDALVDAVVTALGPCDGATLTLLGSSIPYMDPSNAPQGCVQFKIETPEFPEMAFHIEFGTIEDVSTWDCREGDLSREALEDLYTIRGAIVANFDELWYFTCELSARLHLASVELAFGF